MELHPILEVGDEPLLNLWYVISCAGPPCPRVGQACVFDEDENNLIVIGGADPSATYSDIFSLNLLNQKWTKLTVDHLEKRYELCAGLSSNKNIIVFGGANKTENLNSTQIIDTENNTCSVVKCSGEIPCPRTIHSAAWHNDLLFIWGGGHQGAVPVTDLQLHIFNTSSNTWTQPTVKGKLPSARHGHTMVIVEKNLYIHGGMAGATFHKDMHAINITGFTCNKVKQKGSIPCGRAAHAGCAHNKLIYTFGGVSAEGALDDMHCFNAVNNTWAKLSFDCPPPTPRLDHSMLIASLPYVKKEASTSISTAALSPSGGGSSQSAEAPSTKPNIIPVDVWGSNGDDVVHSTTEKLNNLDVSAQSGVETDFLPVVLVFGGMDAAGNIFNDVLLYRIKT